MQSERGLSPVIIQTRCERLEWFMASVPVQRCTLRQISVADVDAFLAAKGAAGAWFSFDRFRVTQGERERTAQPGGFESRTVELRRA